jgi:hypothetical protein
LNLDPRIEDENGNFVEEVLRIGESVIGAAAMNGDDRGRRQRTWTI